MTSRLHGAATVRAIGIGLLVAAFAFGAAPPLSGGALEVEWVPQWLRLEITAALLALANLSTLWPRPTDRRRRRAWWLIAPIGGVLVVYAAVVLATPPLTDPSWSASLRSLLHGRVFLSSFGWPVWSSALVVAADALWCSPLRDTAIDRRLARTGCALWGWGLIAGDAPWLYFEGGIFRSPAFEVVFAVTQPLELRIFYSLLAIGSVALGLALSRRRAGPLWALLVVFTATAICDAIELRAADVLARRSSVAPLDALARTSLMVETALVAIASAIIAWGALGLALGAHRALAPLAPAELPLQPDGHELYLSTCGSWLPWAEPYRGPGRCCNRPR